MTTVRDITRLGCRLVDIRASHGPLLEHYDHGAPKGLSTGWFEFDNLFTLLKGQLNILSGVPSSGKSEWLDAMAVNMAINEKWRIFVYSPENYPLSFYLIKLCEKIVGKPFWQRGDHSPMSKEDMSEAEEFANQQFEFVDSGDEIYSLDRILFSAENVMREGRRIDMLIIDPWNEIEITRPREMTETDYIGACLARCRRFARKHNISFWIVAHPTKMRRDRNGNFPEPTMYDISGSSHWKNKADNGIILHRSDIMSPGNLLTKAKVVKIKNRFYGKPGEHWFEFIPWNGRYKDHHKEIVVQPELCF